MYKSWEFKCFHDASREVLLLTHSVSYFIGEIPERAYNYKKIIFNLSTSEIS